MTYSITYNGKRLDGFYPNANLLGKVTDTLRLTTNKSYMIFRSMEEAGEYINYVKESVEGIEVISDEQKKNKDRIKHIIDNLKLTWD